MASYPKFLLAQDAAYQSHTSRLTELWSLPRPAQGPNTNNNNNNHSWQQWRTQEFFSGRGVQQIQLRAETTGIWGR